MATLDALNKLADAVPQMNARANKNAQAATVVNMQQQIGAAQTGGANVNTVAQQAAPQLIQQQAQLNQQTTQQNQQALGQIADAGLQAQKMADQSSLASQEIANREELAGRANEAQITSTKAELAMRKRVTASEQQATARLQELGIEQDNKLQMATIRQREQLQRLGGDVKDQILDSRLRFETDDMGRKFSNERQLADWTIVNAKNEIEFNDKLREMQQVSDRNIQLLEMAEQRIRQALTNEFTQEQQTLDNEAKVKLAQMAAEMREKLQREQAKAKNRAAAWQSGGMIVGAVAGGVIGTVFPVVGTAAGASLGATIGGAAGSMIGSQMEQS